MEDDLPELESVADAVFPTLPEGESRIPVEDNPTVLQWRNCYDRLALPTMILDDRLHIRWVSRAFRSTFEAGPTFKGEHLDVLFRASPETTLDELEHRVRSSTARFSWRGRLRHRLYGKPTVLANLLVIPLFSGAAPLRPVAWAGIVDDVTGETNQLLRHVFMSLLEASKLKDNDTGFHSERVNRYSRALAEQLVVRDEIDQEFVDDIGFLAAMHDVGKIGTPDDILNKPASLNESEWKIMKEHTINGAYILNTYPNAMAREIALFHHEKWNGSGYPYGLSRTMIPLAARIVAIADVYDALRMVRSYKKSFSHTKAVFIIKKGGQTHFDPALIDVFDAIEPDFDRIFRELADRAGK